MDKLANMLQKLDRIESFLGKVTSMQVQLPTAWRDVKKSVPAEDIDVLLWSSATWHHMLVGYRIGDRFVRSMRREEVEVETQYWMPLPPIPEGL